MRIVVTGGAGFIGSAVVRHLLENRRHHVFNIDKLTYAASPRTLSGLEKNPGYDFLTCDICNQAAVGNVLREFRPDAIIHLAAESHVDRSIDGPDTFVETNTVGTLRLLEAARTYWNSLDAAARAKFRFLHVSTDEVFGALQAGDPKFSASTPYNPRSPYSASKAAADHLVRAWGHTYGLPVIVTNCTNNYGPFHFPEKLIPLMITKALRGEALPIYGNGENIRDWLYVEDHAAALVAAIEHGLPGSTYLIGGGAERTNLSVVQTIADVVDELGPPLPNARKRRELITFVADRPGHDFRYAMDISAIERELGWRPSRTFEDGLKQTVAWFVRNESWWLPLLEHYAGERLGAQAVTAAARA